MMVRLLLVTSPTYPLAWAHKIRRANTDGGATLTFQQRYAVRCESMKADIRLLASADDNGLKILQVARGLKLLISILSGMFQYLGDLPKGSFPLAGFVAKQKER